MNILDEFVDALLHCDTVKVILTGCGESVFETKEIYEDICKLYNENAELKARLSKAVELPCKQFETIFYIIENEIKAGWYIARVGDSTNIVITDKIELGLCWVTDELLFFNYNEAQAKLDEMKGGAV